jgi:hypothetical protein
MLKIECNKKNSGRERKKIRRNVLADVIYILNIYLQVLQVREYVEKYKTDLHLAAFLPLYLFTLASRTAQVQEREETSPKSKPTLNLSKYYNRLDSGS